MPGIPSPNTFDAKTSLPTHRSLWVKKHPDEYAADLLRIRVLTAGRKVAGKTAILLASPLDVQN